MLHIGGGEGFYCVFKFGNLTKYNVGVNWYLLPIADSITKKINIGLLHSMLFFVLSHWTATVVMVRVHASSMVGRGFDPFIDKIKDYKIGVWVSDCCLTQTQQFFSYIMARTSQFSTRWWWCPLCTRPTRLVGFFYNPAPPEGGILFYLCPSFPRYFSSHFSQQLLMAEIWYLVTSFT